MAVGVGDVMKVSLVWIYNNVAEQVNVHHIQVTGIVAQTEAQVQADVMEMLVDAYSTVVGHMASLLVHGRTEFYNLSDAAAMSPLGANAGLNGTNVGEPLPAQVACAPFWRTATPRSRCRTYLPIFTEASNQGGTITAAAITDVATFAGTLMEEFQGTNGVFLTKKLWNVSAGLARTLTSYGVPNRFRTQRRRRVGVGS